MASFFCIEITVNDQQYCFQTNRLGMRSWIESDKGKFVEMNRQPEVMRFFPSIATEANSLAGIERFNQHYDDFGYTYFAVDELATGTWIGFIGLLNQTYESPWTPFVDIGWRLLPSHWGQGLATEGAKGCLQFAMDHTDLEELFATASWKNLPSINVMDKIGMERVGEFVHPTFEAQHELQPIVTYRIQLNR